MAINPTQFPDELVSPEKKATKEYGLNVAKAIFYHHGTYGSPLFINRAQSLHEVRSYINGTQDTSKYKPLAGVDPESDQAQDFIKALRYDVIPYATKRINIAVSKIAQMKYDPVCDAVDETAMDLKKELKNKMKFIMENRDILEDSGILQEQLPEDLSIEDIPTDSDQLEDYLANTKLFAASLIEEAVKEHLGDNDYEQLKRELARDFIEADLGAIQTGLDENVIPYIKRFPVDRLILPKSEYPDFRDAKYWGFLDFVSFSDLEKESQGQFSYDELEIIKDSAREQDLAIYSLSPYHQRNQEDVVRTIPVVRFEWKTTETETYAKKINEFGNPKFYKKKNTYKGSGKNEKIQHKYTSIYEGVWVLGTDLIYNYRRKHFMERSRGNMNETPLSLKVYAPNMRSHESISIGEQIIPILDDLASYNVKIRHILSSPFPNGAEINLNALANVGFEWNGQKMEMGDLVKFMFQKKILITDRVPKQGAQDRAITELNQGIQLQEYLALLQNKIAELDEVLGLNAASVASQLGERAGAATTQMQIQASNQALEFLFYADKKIFMEVCRSLAILHCYSEKYGKPGRYTRIYGRIGSQIFKQNLNLFEHDYSFDFEPYPSDMERQSYIERVNGMAAQGVITGSEASKLLRITNLKKAEFELRRMERRKEKLAHQRELEKIQANAEQQKQSNMVAAQAKQAEMQLEAQNIMLKGEEERKTEALKHQNKMKQIRLERSLEPKPEKQESAK